VRRILNKVILTEAVRSPLQPKSAEHVVADASVIARGGNQTADAPESVDEIC
jgi:hypothetical protein